MKKSFGRKTTITRIVQAVIESPFTRGSQIIPFKECFRKTSVIANNFPCGRRTSGTRSGFVRTKKCVCGSNFERLWSGRVFGWKAQSVDTTHELKEQSKTRRSPEFRTAARVWRFFARRRTRPVIGIRRYSTVRRSSRIHAFHPINNRMFKVK